MAKPWFRFYSETLTDRKIQRICRATDQPKAVVIGMWTILLALSNDSPVPGVLLLTEQIPLTEQDIIAETGLDDVIAQTLIVEFVRFSMLEKHDRFYVLNNWSKRQFASDDVAERVRRYRARKVSTKNGAGNVTVTLQDENCNTPEQTRTDSDQNENRPESEADIAPTAAPQPKPANSRPKQVPSRSLTNTQRQYLFLFGAKRFKTRAQRDAILELEDEHGTEKLLAAGRWAAEKGLRVGDSVAAVRGALPKWGEPKQTKGARQARSPRDYISGEYQDSIQR